MIQPQLGDEPPLALTLDEQEHVPTRRALTFRWLACTCLAGLAGTALVGGALFTALDGRSQIATTPGFVVSGPAAAPREGINSGKGDRLVVLPRKVASRQVIQDTRVQERNGKEFIAVSPYIKVTGTLPLRHGDHPQAVPPLDPMRLYLEPEAVQAKGSSGEDVVDDVADENVRVSYSNLPVDGEVLVATDVLDPRDVAHDVREMAAFSNGGGEYRPLPSAISSSRYQSVGRASPFAAGDLTSALEPNVTTVPKALAMVDARNTEEISVILEPGDSLKSVLMTYGATEEEATRVADAFAARASGTALRAGFEIRLTIARAEGSERRRPVRVTMATEEAKPFVASLLQTGFQPLPTPLRSSWLRGSQPLQTDDRPRANLYDSLYELGMDLDVPQELVSQLVRLFAFDVDFQKTTSSNDKLELFYEPADDESPADTPELLYAALMVGGEASRFYRFRSPDDGEVSFYDTEGRSARKFLMRKPVANAVFTSGFGMRRHPKLGYSRMHTGTDWAAKTGTPIVAAGAGTVIEAGWNSGYGKRVVIRHANGYVTTYNHMSALLVEEGQSVNLGQRIGKVGTTGLSTGPHLHYEVKVNDRFVDAMRIKLPRSRNLSGRSLKLFQEEKARIDALMDRGAASIQVADADDFPGATALQPSVGDD